MLATKGSRMFVKVTTAILIIFCFIRLNYAQFPAEELWRVELDSASFLGPVWQDDEGVSHFLISNIGSNTVSIISEGEEIWESQELPGLITAIHRVDFGVGDGPEIIVGTYADTGRVISLSGDEYENLIVRNTNIRRVSRQNHVFDRRYITLTDNFEHLLPDSSKSLYIGKQSYNRHARLNNEWEESTVTEVDNIIYDIDQDHSPELIVASTVRNAGMDTGAGFRVWWYNFSLDIKVYSPQMDLQSNRNLARIEGGDSHGGQFMRYISLQDIELIYLEAGNSILAASYFDMDYDYVNDSYIEFLSLDSLTTIGDRLPLGEDFIKSMKTIVNPEDQTVYLVCLQESGELTTINVEEQSIIDGYDNFTISAFDIGQFDDDEGLEMVTLSDNRFTFYDLGELYAPYQPQPNQITGFVLHAAYPNPFNAQTVIPFKLASPSVIKILAYDQSGRFIATISNEHLATGSHSISVDASLYSSGNYFLNVVTDEGSISQKITIIK